MGKVSLAYKLLLGLLVALLTCRTSRAQAPAAEPKLPSQIWDHRGSVLSIAFAKGGQWLVTGGAARSEGVIFWDVGTGKRLRGLRGTGLVYSVALSPDGKRIATAGYTNVKADKSKIAVWDTVSGKELFILKTDTVGVKPCVAYSPDGKLLATGAFSSDDEDAVGAVQLWDAATGKRGDLLVGPAEGFSRLAFSPDGKTIAAGTFGAGTFVVLWDVETRKQKAVLKIKKTWSLIRALAFSPTANTSSGSPAMRLTAMPSISSGTSRPGSGSDVCPPTT